MYYIVDMKSLTVRLPEDLVADIEHESRRRQVSKSDVVRERLERNRDLATVPDAILDLADVIGCDQDPPSDVTARKKHYLRTLRYGRKRHR